MTMGTTAATGGAPAMRIERIPGKLNLQRVSREDRARQLSQHLSLNGIRHDANETALFARQLEEIDAELRQVEYPVGHAVDIIPLRTSIDKGATSWTYRAVGRVGQAKRVSNWAKDFPRVDLQGTETENKLYNYGASFGYNLQQLWSSEFARYGLEKNLAEAARAAIAEKLDDILWFGDSEVNLLGLANASGVDVVPVVTGDWTTATAEQILDDMEALIDYIPNNSNSVEKADTLSLPSSSYRIVSKKFFGTTMPVTVLDMFKKANPGVSVVESYKLETADAGGTGPRAIAFRSDMSRLSGLVPIEFMMLPTFEQGGELLVKCLMRAGGVAVERPGSIAFMDDIGA